MSILIKGMEMPQNCDKCRFQSALRLYCDAMPYNFCGNTDDIERPDWCPLVEIPTPHGRLIDADAHIHEIRKQYCEDCTRRKGIKNGKMQFCYEIGGVPCRACDIEDMINAIEDAQTVIEAERSET